MNYFYSEAMNQVDPGRMHEWFCYKDRPVQTALHTMNPSADCFFSEELSELAKNILLKPEAIAKPAGGMGVSALRMTIARFVKEEMDMGRRDDTVMVTGDTYSALELLCRSLTNPGETIICDALIAPEAKRVFEAQGLQFLTVESGNEGIVPEHLEALLAVNTGVRFIYMTPDFQVPTGSCIPDENRAKIAKIAAKHNVIVIEDATWSQIRLYGDDCFPIKTYDEAGAVIYLGSFSPILSEGFGVGYLVANRGLLKHISRFAQLNGSGPSPMCQLICAGFLEKYSYYDKAESACSIYRDRYLAAVNVMEEELPEDIYFTQPDGGFAFWCTDLSERLDAEALAATVAEKYSIGIAPGNLFSVGEEKASHSFRISYAAVDEKQFAEALKKIAEEIRPQMG